MKKKIVLFFAMICMSTLFMGCSSQKGASDASTVTMDVSSYTDSPSESVVSTDETAKPSDSSNSLDILSEAESKSISDIGNENVSDDKTIYTCRINENGHEDFVFEYKGNELVRIEYKVCIKGMPEEIEAATAIKDYSGVIMSYTGDDDGLVVFEIDASNDGLAYLNDTHRLFKNISDHSWNTVKSIMETNGYSCFEN